ncbi:MFS transporter [Plantactinospora mayteni]|uniref:MFS transporter n=1 Tax=Plantactinospora mayteni TaxID=566021 RepID=A0ABQ4EKE9_9ACTN|nr:MFS transporter [Plantactinospora mayteni]GIG95189.1 MFS transporter [Plantactinospora mayteni]
MTTIAPAPRLLSRPLALVMLADFAGLFGFYLLLSVVPAHLTAAGAGGFAAGLATGVLMLSSVAGEFAIPRLVSRYGFRTVLAAGLALLALPVLALLVSAALPVVVAVCVLRGLGLAVIFVVCGAWGAELIPAERRGEGLGVLGIVAGLPAVVATPLGVWLMGHAGAEAVFALGALAALAGLVAVLGMPAGRTTEEAPTGMAAALRSPALMRPAIVFTGTAMAAGIVVTFVPAAVPGGAGSLAAVALLAQAGATTVARWWAGRYGDRHGAARLLIPGALLAAAGILALVLAGNPLAVLAGMVAFGAGFGTVQNASLAMMYSRVSTAAYGTATAVWSIAYDTGYGLGALGFGALASTAGYPIGFALTAAVMVAFAVAGTQPGRANGGTSNSKN